MSKNLYRFAVAQVGEVTVFGASRPGYLDRQVQEWIAFMKAQEIQKVCCLLCDRQLARYSNLLIQIRDRGHTSRRKFPESSKKTAHLTRSLPR